MPINAADKARELQNSGATNLTLPDGASKILIDLQKTIEATTPTEERAKDRVIYSYDINCKNLSYAIASQK
ncbi:hypothetical protein NW759_017364, partial [Fusarium solani]